VNDSFILQLLHLQKRRLGGIKNQSGHDHEKKNAVPEGNHTLVVQLTASYFTESDDLFVILKANFKALSENIFMILYFYCGKCFNC
jgi:hypothetical protein